MKVFRGWLAAVGLTILTPLSGTAQTIVAEAPGSSFENIALGPDNALYVTDGINARILRYSAKDGLSTYAQLDVSPIGIIFDSDGTMYFSAQLRIPGGSGPPCITQGKLIYRAAKGAPPQLYLRAMDAIFLNGWTPLAPGQLLIADSWKGIIWELDTKAGKLSKFIVDPLLDMPRGAPLRIVPPPAAKGIKVHGGYVYISNVAGRMIVRAKLDGQGRPGPIEVVHENVQVNDFEFSPNGTLYFTSRDDKVFRVIGGKIEEFVSGSPAILGNKSLIWAADGSGPYVTTDGGRGTTGCDPPLGPARIVRFDSKD